MYTSEENGVTNETIAVSDQFKVPHETSKL